MSGAAGKQQRAHIGMLMVASALMMAHQVAGKASRDAIFLSQFGTAALPAMVTVATMAADCCSVVGAAPSCGWARSGCARVVST